MVFKKALYAIFLAVVLLTASTIHAATHDEVINGAACIAYPATGGINYQQVLYGFNGASGYCHLTMSDDWPVQNLRYVFFNVLVPSGATSVRLCVHSPNVWAVTCGPLRTVTSSSSAQYWWVNAPNQISPYAIGAFVHFMFPSGLPATQILYVLPYWVK